MPRYKYTKIASIIGVLVNIFLMIIKSLIGFVTKSQSMIADSFISVGDIFFSLMTYIGNKISSKSCDKKYNFGYGKAEYIFSIIISISMIFLSLNIFKDSIIVIINKNKLTYSIWLIIICIICIISKLILYLYTNYLYNKYNNLLMKASSKDHLSDAVITCVNLISCVLSKYGLYYFDGVVGVIISIWVFNIAIKLFRESYDILMDKSIPINIKFKILLLINKYSDIKKIINFKSFPVGYKYLITFTVFIDGKLSIYEGNNIVNQLENEIISKINEISFIIIQLNPI